MRFETFPVPLPAPSSVQWRPHPDPLLARVLTAPSPAVRTQVTGGAGFVGSHLTDKLMMDGHEVTVVDNFFTGRKRNVEHWIGHENFELINHDVVEPLYIEGEREGCPVPVGARRAGGQARRGGGPGMPAASAMRRPCLVLETVSPRPRRHSGPCDGEQPGWGSLDSLSRGSPAFEPRGLLRGLDQGPSVRWPHSLMLAGCGESLLASRELADGGCWAHDESLRVRVQSPPVTLPP